MTSKSRRTPRSEPQFAADGLLILSDAQTAPFQIADEGNDTDWPRAALREKGVTPVVPGKRGRKQKIRHDRGRHRERSRIEAAFSRLRDFRRIATR